MWDRGQIISHTTYRGSSGNDTASGWEEAGNVMYGNGGNDNITGSQNSNFIDGGDGDDTLNGAGAGNEHTRRR